MMRRALLLAGLALLASGSLVFAQTIADEQTALADAQREAQVALRRSQRYDALAARAIDDADKARADAAAIAARIQESEAAIAAARLRIVLIERLRGRQRDRLASDQQPIARLIAALQTMARRPPALALVQPGSLGDLVHTRLLLAATLPVIETRTAGVRAEVARGDRLRAAADRAMAALRTSQQQLATRRTALARLETAQRLRSRQLGDSAFLEQERAQAMGEKARDIVSLMRQMDAQAEISARLASLAGPVMRPLRPGEIPPPAPDSDAARPALRPPYRLPVLGRIVAGTGEISETGVRSRGLSFLAPRGALVIAPAMGRVSFAGPFRGYGTIVIIDHGAGWTTLITGLATLTVAVGDSVVQGGPLGRAEGGTARLTVELRRSGQPIDIAPLAVAG